MGSFCGGDLHDYDYFHKQTSNEVTVKSLAERNKLLEANEVAPLKVVRPKPTFEDALHSAQSSHKLFTDESFPPNDVSLGQHSLSYHPVWARVSEIYPTLQFYNGTISPDKLVPGEVDDSYFISALEAFAMEPKRIEKLFPDLKTHHREGVYMVRIRQQGVRYEVVVDDHIPVNPTTRQPAYMKPLTGDFWPLIIEKAWAKINGSYGAIGKGKAHEALNAISNAPTYDYKINYPSNKQEALIIEEVWQELMRAQKAKWVTCATATSNPQAASTGLVPSQNYTILDAHEIINKREELRLVKLRNPWGRKQWSGRCSDQDKSFWKDLSEEHRRELNHNEFKDDGVFVMNWEDFLHYFDELNLCKYYDDYGYNFVTAVSEKKRASYFKLTTNRKGRAFVSLHQDDMRAKPEFVRQDGLSPVVLILAKKVGDSYRYVSSIMSSRSDQHLEVELTPDGEYYAYCKTLWKVEERGTVTLSVFSEAPVLIEPAKKQPQFLSKTMYDFVKRCDEKQYITSSFKDWFSTRLLVDECGLGVIVVQSSNVAVEVTALQSQLNLAGFVLKHPHKGKEQIREVVRKGQTLVMLARVMPDVLQRKVKFPPPSFQIKLINQK